MYVLEMTIVIKADDKLSLESIQAALVHQVEVLAAGYQVEVVGQPITEVDDGEKEP